MKPALRPRSVTAAFAAVGAILLVALAPATAGADVGYSGPSYGSSTTAPTAEKPQSKTWFHDGRWWGSLYNKAAGQFEIHYLDSSQAWRSTGVAVDTRENTRADFLRDAGKLYAVSAGTSSTNTAHGARLLRYTYDAVARKYTLDNGYPVEITSTGTAAITIAKDNTGTLWATYTQGTNVYLTHSTTDDATWRAPYVMPAPGASNIKADEDQSAIVAFDDRIGVMWSNQSDPKDEAMHWATHADGAADNQWVPNTARRGVEIADNHINLKALDGDPAGQVFAATKTSLDQDSDPLIELMVLDDGVWTRHVVSRKVENNTRAIAAVDPTRRLLYVLSAAPCCSGGDIFYEQTSLDDISFAPGLGVPFIDSSTETKLNNVTSTKQPLTSASGLMALASDDGTRRYGFNLDRDAAPDTAITSGPQGTVDTSSASFAFSSNQRGAGLECRLDGAAFAPCTSPTTYTGLSDGSHTFQVRAVAAGGADPTPAERTWTVDSSTTTSTYAATADSFVDGSLATRNFGASTKMSADTSPQQESYLRFAVGGLLGPVKQATLRLYVANGSSNGPAVYATNGSWTESGITFQNRPAATSTGLDNKGSLAAGTWVSYDVTPFLSGNGELNLKLVADSSDGTDFSTREAAANQPQLVVRHYSAAPETTIDSAPSDPSNSAEAAFSFSSSKPGSFECQLDGGAFEACEPGSTYTGLSDGSHTFAVRAVDASGQLDESPATHTWRVDTAAPVAPEISSPAEGFTSASQSVTLGGTAEANSIVSLSEGSTALGTVRTDQGGAWSREVSFDDGSHAVTATATDAAGNVSAPSTIRTFRVDSGPPETRIDSGPSGRISETSASFSFSSEDPDATFRCRLDGAPEGSCTSPHGLAGLGEGEHTFEVRAVDAAENVDATPASRTWTVDVTAPTVSSVTPAADATGVDATADVQATFSEDVAAATLDRTSFTLTRQGDSDAVEASVSLAADGRSASLDPSARLDAEATYTARIKGGVGGVEDVAGNPLAGDKSWSFAVDASAPTPETTIDSGPTGTIASDSASFAFSADLPDSSFECSLDGAGFEPCASPRTYTGLSDGQHSFAVRAVSGDGVVDPTPAQQSWTVETLLFSDGFELGDLSRWSSVRTGADGEAVVQSATVRGGALAARLSATANTGSYAYARRSLSPGETDVTVSGDFRVEQEGASGGNVPFLRLYDAGGARLISLYRQNLSGDKIRVTHSGAGADTTGRLPLGQWGRLRLRVKTNGTGASTVEVFLDGAEIYRTTTASLGSQGVSAVQIGNDTARQPFTILVDDVEVRR